MGRAVAPLGAANRLVDDQDPAVVGSQPESERVGFAAVRGEDGGHEAALPQPGQGHGLVDVAIG